jgi:peptidyl-tRNA hydrolase, PTH1 family
MVLIVGLGNPGGRYENNRHNIGFRAVEAIARRHRFAPWKLSSSFQGKTTKGDIAGQNVLLLCPETFMNDSGRSVQRTMHFFKLQLPDLAVVHDEIELPPAKVRVKVGGGIAGHNGLRSVSEHVGNDYRRVRIGVGHPGVKDLVHAHVLSDFAKSERAWVDALCDVIADNADLLVKGQDASFQNKVHLAMQAKGFHELQLPGAAGRQQTD